MKSQKPIEFGLPGFLLFLPILLAAGALSIPYGILRRKIVARREAKFLESMKLMGRTMSWTDFFSELNRGTGTLIVERFSFKGPVRFWWARDNLYQSCPYPLVDWLTMVKDAKFHGARNWCSAEYTSVTGKAMLVIGSRDEWRRIRAKDPLRFREGFQFLEIPPPRHPDMTS